MTRMQIIAKAVLTSLGVYCIIQFTQVLTVVYFRLLKDCSFTKTAIGVCISITFIIFLLYFFIINNNRLAVKMAGPGERLSPDSQILWLAASLRAAALFCGIILLAGSIKVLGNILLALWPPNFRQWITQIINSGTFFGNSKSFLRQPAYMIYSYLKLALALYLLYGAPQFVSWQMKSALKAGVTSLSKSEGIQNE